MGDILKDAVSSALGAVASALPSLCPSMTAGGATASVAILSRSAKEFPQNALAQTWNSDGVNSDVRIAARVDDFPFIVEGMPIRLDGEYRIIVSLKNTGNAAWFIDLSDSVNEVLVSVHGLRRFAGSVRHVAQTVCAAVVYTGYEEAAGDASIASRKVHADIYVPKSGGDYAWLEETPPQQGDIVTVKDGSRYAVDSVDTFPNSWKLTARRCA